MKRSATMLTVLSMVLASPFLSFKGAGASTATKEVKVSAQTQSNIPSCYTFLLECDIIETYCGIGELSYEDYDYARALLNIMDCDWGEPTSPVYYA